jgi:hypothetical protein
MASTWTSSLKIQLMQTGENATTWGNVTNDNLEYGLEEAIVGTGTVTFASNNQTLTLSNSNASQTARNMRLNLAGVTGGATRTLTIPDSEKVYIINNTCADAVQVANSTGSNISVPAGKTMWVYSTGTGVVNAVTHLTSLTLATPLATSQGGTGSTSTTYANLQSNVSGILPVANGGTGSATAAFNGSLITNLNATAISSGQISNTYTTANTSNGSNTIVLRSSGGNFSANTITASLTGNVTGNVTGNILQNYMQVNETQATNTAGGASLTATWITRILNTNVVTTITGATLVPISNLITLPAGQYYISASAPAYAINGHRLRVFNVSDGVVVPNLVGPGEYASSDQSRALVNGRFTFASTKSIRIDHYTQSARATNGLGVQVNATGFSEIYTVVEIWKLN